MPAGLGLRIATVAVLLAVLLAIGLALRLRRLPGEAPHGLWRHVEELRRRLLVVSAVVVAGITVAMTVRIDLSGTWPVPRLSVYEAMSAQLFAAMVRDVVPAGVTLVVTSPMDGFVAQFDIAVAIGLLLGLPVALDQAARFLSPALREAERRFLRRALLPAIALFVLGAAFGYAVVLPVTLDALYRFSDGLGAASLLSVADFGGFVLSFLAGFGLAFQTPLVMVALTRIGLVEPRTYWRYWRHAVLVLLVVAMIVTPDPTIVSQLMLAVPMVALYVLGAVLSQRMADRTGPTS